MRRQEEAARRGGARQDARLRGSEARSRGGTRVDELSARAENGQAARRVVASSCSDTRDHPHTPRALCEIRENLRTRRDATRRDASRPSSGSWNEPSTRTTQLINCKLTARLTWRLTYDKLDTRQIYIHMYVYVFVYTGTFVGERGGPDVGG